MKGPALVERVRGWLTRGDAEFAEEVAGEHDAVARRVLRETVEDHEADVFAAGGDGVIVPDLPTGTEADLYHAFERDEEPPADAAP